MNQTSYASSAKAARLAGLLFLVAMATGLFAEFYVRFPTSLIVTGNLSKTLNNIASHERLYRIGIANNLITFVIDVVLIWALYIVLKPVHRNLARLAVFFRLIETTLACSAVICSYVAMQLITDNNFNGDAIQLQTLSVLHTTYAMSFNVIAIFLGFGSTIFNYLFFKSGYIPKLLAGWGILSAIILLISELIIIVFPNVENTIIPAAFGPIALDEILLGFWLLFKGIKVSPLFSS